MDINILLQFQYGTGFLSEYLLVFALQTILYLAAACSVSLFYKLCVKANIGSQINTRPTYPNQVRNEIFWSVATCAVIAAYFYASFMFVDHVYPRDWSQALGFTLVFVTVYDFYMYLTHRALHTKWLKRFHARHHTSISTTPFACINVHPIEALINYLPFLVFAYLAPVSLVTLLAIHAYLIVGIANGHSNYNLWPSPRTPYLLRELTTFHQKHHGDGRGNFGYLLSHWDWVFDTRHK